MSEGAGFVVRPVQLDADAREWAGMREALWPDEVDVGGPGDLREALRTPAEACVLIAHAEGGCAIGFAEASRRVDYVNGTGTSPVGFLEALYVAPAWRRRGVGRALVAGIEAWTRDIGCSELASDALLDNHASHAAHLGYGFVETERVVYFRKPV